MFLMFENSARGRFISAAALAVPQNLTARSSMNLNRQFNRGLTQVDADIEAPLLATVFTFRVKSALNRKHSERNFLSAFLCVPLRFLGNAFGKRCFRVPDDSLWRKSAVTCICSNQL